LTADELISAVALEYGVAGEDICSTTRGPLLDEAKRAAHYLVRQNTSLGWKPLAALFRCSYANTRFKVTFATRQIWTDDAFAGRVRGLEEKLGLKKTVDDVREMAESELPPDLSPSGSKNLKRADIAGARVYQRGDA